MAPETPRAVSSRLLTMKFMQRAAASGSSAGSPGSEPPSSKKRKLEHSPAERKIEADITQASIQAALDDREAKRLAALEQHSAADTHWVLKPRLDGTKAGKPANARLNVVYVGYGDIDSDESGGDDDAPPKGRTATRDYRPSKKAKAKNESAGEDDSSEESSDGDDGSPRRQDAPSGGNSRSQSARGDSRSRSQSRQRAQDPKAKEFRDKRKKKEVHLNKLVSISSSGDGKFGAQASSNTKSMTCYNCQQVGHRASECPSQKKGSRGSQKRQ